MPRLPQPMIPMRMRSLAPMLRCAVLASTPRGATSDTAPAAAIDARKSRRDCVDMLIVRLLVGAMGRLRDSRPLAFILQPQPLASGLQPVAFSAPAPKRRRLRVFAD